MTNHFCDLPQELRIQILSNLDAVSLIHCAMTCTSIYDTLKGSSLLAYSIQLYLDGLKDGEISLGYTERIASLVRRRQAWLALEMKGPITVQTQPDCEACELAGGAFAALGRDYFEVIWLPTASNADASMLRRPLDSISIREFTMDPTQDLIVFLEEDRRPPSTNGAYILHIHIRTISANTVHQLAQQSPLQFTVVPGYGDLAYAHYLTVLQIAYDVVAVRFCNSLGETRALVWDWKTSDLLLDTSTSFDPWLPSLVYDFGLLDSTYFLITTPANSGAIRIYKLVQSPTAAPQAIHLASLHLPPTVPSTTVRYIAHQAGAIEAHPRPWVPFTVHDAHRLHMFTVQYLHAPHSGSVGYRDVDVFLHQRVLLEYARRACGAHVPLEVPWVEWGPPNTRMALSSPRQNLSYWRRYVYGQRAVSTQRGSGTEEPSCAVDVFDFSLAAVLSAQGVLGTPATASATGKPGRLLPSSVIRMEEVQLFLDNIETHLPCVRSTLDLRENYTSYMIYADGIMGVNSDTNERFVLNIYPI